MTLTAADIRAKRRLELAAFLRERRSALRPEDVGLARRGRRHVKGLRRDEVAALAGIGVSWYTLIEQGRDVNVSADAIVRIGEALRLDPFAMSHALALALPDVPSEARQEVDADVLERLQAILDTQHLNPAHVLNDAMTVVAWNALAERFYGFRRNAEGFERNFLWRLFNDAAFAKLFLDWDDSITNIVGLLRYKYARSVGNAEYEGLVHELYKTQPEFRRIWDTHHVNGKQTEICRFDHPLVGTCELRLLYSTVHVEPPLVIAFLTPSDPRSVIAMERLERMNVPLSVAT